MTAFADPCDHSQHHGLETCPGLTPAELEFGEKVRSVALNFVGSAGRENWHSDHGTVREQKQEMFDNAIRSGNAPPESLRRRPLV